MSEIVEIGKDTVNLTVVDNNVSLNVTTSQISLETASVGPQGIPGATGPAGIDGVTYYGISSTSNITIGSGLKTWTVANVGAFLPGMRIRAIHSDTPSYWMEGFSNVASGTTIIITVDKFNGSGSHNSWKFAVAGEVGNTGAKGDTGAGVPVGGNAGQVLSKKTTNTDYDTQWINPNTGTVTSVAVSLPLTGGPITSTGTISLGTVGVANGGTGQITHTSGAVLIGNGTGAITSTAVTTTGNTNSIVKTNTFGGINAGDGGFYTTGSVTAVGDLSGNALRLSNNSDGTVANLYFNSGLSQNYYLPLDSGTLIASDSSGNIHSDGTISTNGAALTTGGIQIFDGANGTYGSISYSSTGNSTYTFPTSSGTLIGTGDVLTISSGMIKDSAITSAKIVDGTIVNADINASAAIADTKLAQITTANKVSTSAITGLLPIANGGTNAADAATARTNLGAISQSNVNGYLNGSTTGLDLYPKFNALGTTANTAMTSGTIRTTTFVPMSNISVSNVGVIVTAVKSTTSSTTEFGRFALASYDGTSTYTILARTAQTTGFATATGLTTIALDSTVNLTAGTTYAILFLWYSNGTITTTPSIAGSAVSTTISFANPKMGTASTGNTDISATSVTASTAAAAIFWARLT